MNREETEAAAAVMQAYADGKEIQWAYPNRENWSPVSDAGVNWNWPDYKYRVKPQTVKYRLYLYKYANGNMVVCSIGTAPDRQGYEHDSGFVKWLGDWQEAEV